MKQSDDDRPGPPSTSDADNTYPPARHLLRDLGIVIDRDDAGARASLAIVPEIGDATGRPRLGAVATLVDVVAGETAIRAIRAILPGWTATSDLGLYVDELPMHGSIEATPRVLRSGRQTVILEVALRSVDEARELGFATLGFAVLPVRSDLQKSDQWADTPERHTEFALPDSGFRKPVLDAIGLEFDPSDPGIARIDVSPYLRNSLGALQGGAVATVLEASAEHRAAALLDGPLRVRSLAIHFLKLARVGPIRAEARPFSRSAGGLLLRVELFDEGAEDALLTVGVAQVDEA